MQLLRLTPMLLLILLYSCEARFDWPWLDKDAPADEHHATGETVTEDRAVGAFQHIILDGVGTLIFDSSIPPGTLRVHADKGILGAIESTITDDTLLIREEGIQGPDSWDIEFRVAAPGNLAGVKLGGLGAIESDSVIKTSEALSVSLEGMGRIRLEVDAPTVIAVQKGSGELVLTGKANAVQIVAQGLGKVNAEELIALQADVQSQGVGAVTVFASETLKVRAQGLGAVMFSGHPKQTDVQTEGMTKVSASE